MYISCVVVFTNNCMPLIDSIGCTFLKENEVKSKTLYTLTKLDLNLNVSGIWSTTLSVMPQ